jgi:hypothetical protein
MDFRRPVYGGKQGFDLPETSVRFGIVNKTELRFAAPDYFFSDNTGSGFATGFGDLNLGLKQQLGPTRGGFNVSLIPSVSLPTGANVISSHGYDPAIQLLWSRALTKNWTAAGMFSVTWPTEAARRNLTGSPVCILTGSFEKPGTPTSNIPALFPNAVVRST